MSNDEIVRLNVGGTKYLTAKSTLRKYPQSMLGAMFTENVSLSQTKMVITLLIDVDIFFNLICNF